MRTPEPFDLALTVESHGWYSLAPWRWDRERRTLARPLQLATGRVVDVQVAPAPGGLAFRAHGPGRLSGAEGREARAQLAASLALDEDLSSFRARAAELEALRAAGRARDLPDLRWALARGAGRLLRSPTVFEDAVKTLCTTNCTWAVTRGMVGRLCQELGLAGPLGEPGFPTAEAMAARDERFYRGTIRAGYRARFLVSLSQAVARGALELEALRGPGAASISTEDMARRIRALDGFGPYATEHLLRLLGRHGLLALDSWNRAKLARLRGKRRPPGDRTLRRWYARYGEWAGLAMWLEVTADWHGPEPRRP